MPLRNHRSSRSGSLDHWTTGTSPPRYLGLARARRYPSPVHILPSAIITIASFTTYHLDNIIETIVNFDFAPNEHRLKIAANLPTPPSNNATTVLMPISPFPEPSGAVPTHPRGHSAASQARRDILSDIPESSSDGSADDNSSISLNGPAGDILRLIRESAHEIIASTGGPSPPPTSSANAQSTDDNGLQLQHITRMSDDIVRNLARMLTLKADKVDEDDMMTETPMTESENISPLPMASPGLLRARRPPLRQRGSRLTCRDCRCIVTPKWRPGPHGPATLCNVCGLLYAKRMGIIEGLHDR